MWTQLSCNLRESLRCRRILSHKERCVCTMQNISSIRASKHSGFSKHPIAVYTSIWAVFCAFSTILVFSLSFTCLFINFTCFQKNAYILSQTLQTQLYLPFLKHKKRGLELLRILKKYIMELGLKNIVCYRSALCNKIHGTHALVPSSTQIFP